MSNEKPNLARDGAQKNIKAAPITPGMKRQTTGELHPYLHGQCVEDEPLQKTYESPATVHPATTAKQRAAVHPNGAADILSGAVAPNGTK
jgi:hypothetical protein